MKIISPYSVVTYTYHVNVSLKDYYQDLPYHHYYWCSCWSLDWQDWIDLVCFYFWGFFIRFVWSIGLTFSLICLCRIVGFIGLLTIFLCFIWFCVLCDGTRRLFSGHLLRCFGIKLCGRWFVHGCYALSTYWYSKYLMLFHWTPEHFLSLRFHFIKIYLHMSWVYTLR